MSYSGPNKLILGTGLAFGVYVTMAVFLMHSIFLPFLVFGVMMLSLVVMFFTVRALLRTRYGQAIKSVRNQVLFGVVSLGSLFVVFLMDALLPNYPSIVSLIAIWLAIALFSLSCVGWMLLVGNAIGLVIAVGRRLSYSGRFGLYCVVFFLPVLVTGLLVAAVPVVERAILVGVAGALFIVLTFADVCQYPPGEKWTRYEPLAGILARLLSGDR